MAPTNINYLLPKGDLLKARRMELGLTQDDLAEKSNVSKNTISAYERNASRATPSSAKALAEALDMELVDLFEYPAAVEEVEEVDEVEVEEATSRVANPALKITSQADDALRMASVGLEKEEGSTERVSYAIASITGYLRSIIHRAPELKKNSQGLVDAITATLASAVLDPDHSSMEVLWSVIKNGIADLKELERLPKQAKQEADSIIAQLQQARLDNDDTERLRAVKSALFWLHDYWDSICMEQSAYNALSGVSCAMSSAPTDYATRARLVAHVNTFAAYVAMYDPVYREIHKGERNG